MPRLRDLIGPVEMGQRLVAVEQRLAELEEAPRLPAPAAAAAAPRPRKATPAKKAAPKKAAPAATD